MYLRDVVEEPRFTQDLDSYRPLYDHMDDVHQAITWTLSRDPRVADPLEHFPDFRRFITTAIGDTPAFWVLYSFDETRVYLHSLELAGE
jgi:hypothetical protein